MLSEKRGRDRKIVVRDFMVRNDRVGKISSMMSTSKKTSQYRTSCLYNSMGLYEEVVVEVWSQWMSFWRSATAFRTKTRPGDMIVDVVMEN